MAYLSTILLLLLLGAIAFTLGRKRILSLNDGRSCHTLPRYYGYAAILWSLLPALTLLIFLPSSVTPALICMAALAAALPGLIWASNYMKASFPARRISEGMMRWLLMACTGISILVTVFIVLSVCVEAFRFFGKVPVTEFLFGLKWSPQTAMRADQAGGSGAFGAVAVFTGTLLITTVAMLVAAPLGLLSAIYLSEYASARTRNYIKPALEVLAGIPTVVYGYFAVVTFAPFLKNLGAGLGVEIASESALGAGIVMGIMIIPFILSLSDDVMHAVPKSLKEASLGLGATPSETIVKVVVPAALPGIMGALLLAISRGIGETMIVVMAAGLAANLTINPLDSVTTVTAQIVTLLVGDQEFDSAKTLAAFALGLTLFAITLVLNIIALIIVRKYREKYE